MAVTGRGRGRARILMANLRKPGEVASPQESKNVAPPPGFEAIGRGAILKISTDSNKKWAGASPAPAAESAPLPPSSWVG